MREIKGDVMNEISWKQVFEDWREAEKGRWKSVYEERGYDSWWEWRKSYVNDLNLEKRTWTEHTEEDPHTFVANLHVGGYRGWKKYRPAKVDAALFWQVAQPAKPLSSNIQSGGEKSWQTVVPFDKDGLPLYTVEDLLEPEQVGYGGETRVDVRTNKTVMDFVGNLHDTTILVLKCEDFQVLLDGHHRCAAIAVELIDGRRSSFDLTVRTCHFESDELALLEAFAKDRQIVVKKKND